MFTNNLKSIRLSITALLVAFLASCSCSNNAPIRDLIVPEITSTTPSSNSKNAVINTFINVTFSERMSESSINSSTFQLLDNTGRTVSGAVTYSGTSATLKPDQALTKNSDYSVKLSRQMKDSAGNQILSDYIWQFTTGVLTDTSAPTVDEVLPEPYTGSVALNTNIEISLTELVSASSITADNFIVTDSESNIVTGIFTVEDRKITFDPEQDLTSDTKYTVTLTTGVQDLAGNGLAFDYITQFTTVKITDTEPPLVNSVSPASNATDVARNINIIASFNEDINAESVTASSLLVTDENNQVIPGILGISGANAIFEPTTPFTSDTTYTVTLSNDVEDLFANKLQTTFSWNFTTGSSNDTSGPTVTSINPENDATNISANNAITVTFSEEINPVSLSTQGVPNIQVRNNAGLVEADINYSGNTIIFRPKALLADNSTYTASLIANITDLAGNKMSEDYSWKFTTGITRDREIPSVTSVYPEDNTSNVAVNTAIVARFSEAMDPSSINAESVTIVDDAGNAIVGIMKTIGASVTFRPIQSLAFSTNYIVTITDQAADLATNSLEESFTWQFSTSTEEDNTKPTITSTVPASSSNFAPINRGLIVTFSETMDQESINSSTFYMTNTSGDLIAGNINYAGNTVTFMPNDNLVFSQSYIATVAADVRDMSGNTLGLIHSWSFTTSSEIDTTAPQISSTLPTDGSLAVNNTPITINFDKDMDTSSFNTANIKLYNASNELIPGTISGTSESAVFIPAHDLEYESEYSVIVGTGIRDLARNHLATDYSWTFQTSLPPNLAPPFVVSVTPKHNQDKVKLLSTLNVLFSEAINCTTVSTSNFTLSQNNTPVSGAIGCNDSTISFTPTDALLTESTYIANLDVSIQDMQNTALTEIYSWQFTTAPWTQQFGSVSLDQGNAITTDNSDNIYTAGNTGGSLATLNNGLTDIFISKHSKNSVLVWSKQFGSNNVDEITDITIDSSGNIYVCGYSYGDFAASSNSSADIIVLKIDNNGNEIWKKQMGTVQDDVATAIQLDSNGDLVLTGYSSTGFDTHLSNGLHDVIVLKLSTDGTLIWSQQFGSVLKDIANDLVIDSDDNIYVVGYSEGDIDGNPNNGFDDIFITKLNTNSTIQWTHQIGTSSTDQATAVAIDSSDNIYISGFSAGALDGNTALGSNDQIVLKYDSSGTLLWSTQLGTDKDDRAYTIEIDNNDGVLISGYTLGNMEGPNAGDSDLTLIKLDSSATQEWIQQYGTAESDISFAVTYDSNDNIYLTGRSQGELDGNQNAGSDDIIIMKWDELGAKQ